MGPHFFKIKLCWLNSLIRAAWSEIEFEANQVFINQKVKKLKEEKSLSFGPTGSTDSL